MSLSTTSSNNANDAPHNLFVGDKILCCVYDRGWVEATITSISESSTHTEAWTIDTDRGMMMNDEFTLLTSNNTDNIPEGGIKTLLSLVNPQVGSAVVNNPRMRDLARIMNGEMPHEAVLGQYNANPTRSERKKEEDLERMHRRSMEHTQCLAKEIAKLDQPSTPKAAVRSWRDDDADEDCANKPSDNNNCAASLGSYFDDSDSDDNTSTSEAALISSLATLSYVASSSVPTTTTCKSFDWSMEERHEPAGASPTHSEDFTNFLKKVRSHFDKDSLKFGKFHKLVTDKRFGKDYIYVGNVVQQLLTLFDGCTDLLLEFNKFLPGGVKICEADISNNVQRREKARLKKQKQREQKRWKDVEQGLNKGLPFCPTKVDFFDGLGGTGAESWNRGLSNKLDATSLPWMSATLRTRSGTITLPGSGGEKMDNAVVIGLHNGTSTAIQASAIRIKQESVVTIRTVNQKTGTLGLPLTGPILGADGTKYVLIRWESKREELVWVEEGHVQSKWSFEHGWTTEEKRPKCAPKRLGFCTKDGDTQESSLVEAPSRGGEALSGPDKDVIDKLVAGAAEIIRANPRTTITVALGASLQANRSEIRSNNPQRVLDLAEQTLTYMVFTGELSGRSQALDDVLQSPGARSSGDYVSQIASLGWGTFFTEHKTMHGLLIGGGHKGGVVVEVDKMQKKPAEQDKTCKEEGSASKKRKASKGKKEKGASKKKKLCKNNNCGNQSRRHGGLCNTCFGKTTGGAQKSVCSYCGRPAREHGGRCPQCIKAGLNSKKSCKICGQNPGREKGGICRHCQSKEHWDNVMVSNAKEDEGGADQPAPTRKQTDGSKMSQHDEVMAEEKSTSSNVRHKCHFIEAPKAPGQESPILQCSGSEEPACGQTILPTDDLKFLRGCLKRTASM
jgi:hypothetical protein